MPGASQLEDFNPITDTHQTSPVSLIVNADSIENLQDFRSLIIDQNKNHEFLNNNDESFTIHYDEQQEAEDIEAKLQEFAKNKEMKPNSFSFVLEYETLSHPGNIYVRGLDELTVSVDQLRSIFETYGALLDCKIVRDSSTGKSKGFGFVNFKNGSAARAAIAELNDTTPEWNNNKVLYLNRHISKKERVARLKLEKMNFKNLYVKNIDKQSNPDDILLLFKGFGKIDSYFLPKVGETSDADNDFDAEDEFHKDEHSEAEVPSVHGELKGYGFIKFFEHDNALEAMQKLDNYEFNGKRLQISRAQRREERNMMDKPPKRKSFPLTINGFYNSSQNHHGGQNYNHGSRRHSYMNRNNNLSRMNSNAIMMSQFPMTYPNGFFPNNAYFSMMPVNKSLATDFGEGYLNGTQVKVNNIPAEWNLEFLKQVVEPFGNIMNVNIDDGIIVFTDFETAKNAVTELNKQFADDSMDFTIIPFDGNGFNYNSMSMGPIPTYFMGSSVISPDPYVGGMFMAGQGPPDDEYYEGSQTMISPLMNPYLANMINPGQANAVPSDSYTFTNTSAYNKPYYPNSEISNGVLMYCNDNSNNVSDKDGEYYPCDMNMNGHKRYNGYNYKNNFNRNHNHYMNVNNRGNHNGYANNARYLNKNNGFNSSRDKSKASIGGISNLYKLLRDLKTKNLQNTKMVRNDLILSYLEPKFVEEAHKLQLSDKHDDSELNSKISDLNSSDIRNILIEVLEKFREICSNSTQDELSIDLNVVDSWLKEPSKLVSTIKDIVNSW